MPSDRGVNGSENCLPFIEPRWEGTSILLFQQSDATFGAGEEGIVDLEASVRLPHLNWGYLSFTQAAAGENRLALLHSTISGSTGTLF